MTHNSIDSIPTKIFKKFYNSLTINLGDNKLKAITADILLETDKFHKIIINNNYLDYQHNNLKRLIRSKLVDLRGNKCIRRQCFRSGSVAVSLCNALKMKIAFCGSE